MASKRKPFYAGGRWRDALGRYTTAAKVAPVVKAPPRTVRVEERQPHKYVRITVNERIRVPDKYGGKDRLVEVHASRTIKSPTRAQERRARRALREDVSRKVAEVSKRERLGEKVSRVVGVETSIVRRGGRAVVKAEIRAAKTGERTTKTYVR